MSDRFQVGDMVEAIRASDDPEDIPVGDVVWVEAVDCGDDSECGWDPDCAGQALFFAGRPDTDGFGWCGCCFRLIHRPRADFLTELLSKPVPAEEPA